MPCALQVNFADLIRNQQPDKNGNTIPLTVTSGAYQLKIVSRPLQTSVYEGKVITDKTYGHATYSCLICCGYRNIGFAPEPVFLLDGFTVASPVDGTDTCGGTQTDISTYFPTWSSSDTSIFTMSQAQITGVSPGSANRTALTQSLPEAGPGHYHPYYCPVMSSGATGTGNVSACQIPTGESTQAVRQTSQGSDAPTSTDFLQTLSFTQIGTTDPGATVGESEGASGVDGCWFSTSAIPAVNSVTGSQGWVVGGVTPGFAESQVVTPGPGQWGPDEVGYSPAAVVYYQQNRPKLGLSLPCSFTVYQNLSLTCPGKGPVDFVSNAVLTSTIDPTGLTNCREGVCTAHIPYQ